MDGTPEIGRDSEPKLASFEGFSYLHNPPRKQQDVLGWLMDAWDDPLEDFKVAVNRIVNDKQELQTLVVNTAGQ